MEALTLLALIVLVGGFVWLLPIWLCMTIAEGKGRSPWGGLIVGLVFVWIGVVLMLIFPAARSRAAPGRRYIPAAANQRVSRSPTLRILFLISVVASVVLAALVWLDGL